MNLRQLEIFCTVMRCRTTIAASYELGLSQPAVSNAIKHFESMLGFTLFDRIGNRLVPTAEGQSIFQDAQPLHMMAAALNQKAKDLKDTKTGHLRVLSTRPLGDNIIPAAIARFMRGREKVNIYFDVQHMNNVIEAVESGYADLAIALTPPPRPGLELSKLIDGRMVCALPEAHPLAQKQILSPIDLEHVPVIGLDPLSRLGSTVATAFHEAGVPFSPSLNVLQGAAACSLVSNGLGVAIVDEFSASSWVAEGLVIRAFEPSIAVHATLISLKDRPLTRLARKFVQVTTDLIHQTQRNGIAAKPAAAERLS
ncbi:LysR substrate-binding domain-containing protein [Mesorhizobium sp. M7D.F.Ca.US.004.03.1.1]|uniref:LysR family transcriptional regulator n=1 Tax=Mesorhizobium sp. M7D.F.Ca.US.004.03.1.1 TaxID=2496702 RepID=UPI0013E2C646|nr:LysR substrate-binding domain-containing protein [Mesorhizobium sp. M7D.F.Ca.US.004.03.1.1]